VPDAELARAVAGGLVKVNIGTALNIAFTGAVRGWLEQAPAGAVDPRKYLTPAREEMAKTASHFINILSSNAD
jgi:fructose-bisphosphate aldolase class II